MWRRGGYGRGFWQRFGFYDRGTHKKLLASSGRIWIHAVSVGEILVALRFVDELRKGRGCPGFVVSTTTSTGYALARKLMHPDDVLVYFPLDFPVVLRRVLPVLNPRALVLTECEIWPNLIRLLKQRKVPIVLINGRISRSSYRGYEKIRLFLTPILRWVDLFLVQTDADRERLISLGAEPGKVVVTGSAKYDEVRADVDGEQMARSLIEAAGIGSNDPILLGGSTWPGEETVLMETQRRLRARWPNLRLILVPRHVERADKIAREIRARGLNCVKRSALPSLSL
ncbi:MAG: 3-deoxy-D-manno-octulosonic acid transferase, partial [Kiritimatiellae bacterium]|nr:3-deoxy-D-manno-octulosonic acid transferase [Kiritimatiellia bacterium]